MYNTAKIKKYNEKFFSKVHISNALVQIISLFLIESSLRCYQKDRITILNSDVDFKKNEYII